MSKDKSNKGIADGILGGLVVSFFNFFSQNNYNNNDWEAVEIFSSFSYEENRKKKGYKLKYDINESKIKSKFLNLIQIDEYLYSIRLSNKIIEGVINHPKLESSWEWTQLSINSILESNLYEGLVELDTIKPNYWIYSIKEREDYIKIIITDKETGDFNNKKRIFLNEKDILDDYICLELDEARQLAKEMKQFYHNHVERVMVLEEMDMSPCMNKVDYRAWIQEVVPSYYKILENIKKIDIEKYNIIGDLLEKSRLDNPLHLLFRLFSLAVELYKDQYYNYSIMVLKGLLDSKKSLLIQSKLEDKIHEEMIDIYIELKKEKEIINLIQDIYKDDYQLMNRLAKRLYDLELYAAANSAYNVVIENEDLITFSWDVFEAYLRTQNDEGMKIWREKLVRKGQETWRIDRYLNNEDEEGLKIRIEGFEKEENWEQVIKYCNKYNSLILKHARKKIGDGINYELKKIDAYIKLNNFDGAWNSSCKARGVLIANFNGVNYLEHLSKVEFYMTVIASKQKYTLDALYHYVIHYIYKDIFLFYEYGKELDLNWGADKFLKSFIKKTDLKELWPKIETIIKNEYINISKETIRNINIKIINILKENNYDLMLDKPKKYFPNTISRDFNIE